MQVAIQSGTYDLPRSIEEKIHSKLDTLSTSIPDGDAMFARVTIKDNNRYEGHTEMYTVKIGVTPVHGHNLQISAEASEVQAALELAFAKLDERVRRSRDIRDRSRHRSEGKHYSDFGSSEEDVGDTTPRIIRRKVFDLKPMSAEEALLQMEILKHSFFLYTDAITGMPAVIYRRNDGDYGVIESE